MLGREWEYVCIYECSGRSEDVMAANPLLSFLNPGIAAHKCMSMHGTGLLPTLCQSLVGTQRIV